MSQIPPIVPGPIGSMRPHRGVMILVLGILGIVLCMICGIIAWVMGNADLKEIDAGRMDPTGRGLTQAGKICGMISVILTCLGLAIWLVLVVLMGGLAAAGAAGAGGGGGP